MRKFFNEFKKFITRGNVIDLAVGVIIGSAFTAIVNALTKNVLTPVINWILASVLGKDSLSAVFTFLKKVEDPATGLVDLAQSIYIDWGSVITAIINFLLTAFVLFLIIKAINHVKEGNAKFSKKLAKGIPTKEDKKEMKKRGINRFDYDQVKAFLAEKQANIEKAEAEAKAKKEAEEAEAKRHTTEGLLEEIKALLEKQVK